MAYYRENQIRTAFGRPPSSRQGEVPGLGLVFLLLLVGGLASIWLVLGMAGGDSGAGRGVSRLSRLLGYGEPERVRVGYVPPAEAQAAPTPEVAGVQVAPPPAAPPQPTAAPAPTPKPDHFRVANTDGLGVVLHTAPSRTARVPRGLMEGTRVTVLERVGGEWARVRAESGQEGWVGAAYLAPD